MKEKLDNLHIIKVMCVLSLLNQIHQSINNLLLKFNENYNQLRINWIKLKKTVVKVKINTKNNHTQN